MIRSDVQAATSPKFKGPYWQKFCCAFFLTFWFSLLSFAFEPQELLVLPEKAVTSRVLWSLYDTSELDLVHPEHNPGYWQILATHIAHLQSRGTKVYLVRLKPEYLPRTPSFFDHYEVIDQATFEKRFGRIDTDYFIHHLPAPEDHEGNGTPKKPLATQELFQFTDKAGRTWAVLDMTPYDTVEKLYHVHPDIRRVVQDIRHIEGKGDIAYIVQEKFPNDPDRPAGPMQVIEQSELFKNIAPETLDAKFRWKNIHKRLTLLINQYIRPGKFDKLVLIKGSSTATSIFLWSAMHPVVENRVPVDQALMAAVVGGLWAGFIVYHSQSVRNIFAKPNRLTSVFVRSFLHSVLFALVITSIKANNFSILDLAVWSHLGFHAIKSTWAKFKWKALIKKVQDRAAHGKEGVITRARNHDFAFELIYDFVKAIDLLDVDDNKHTEGKSLGGELLGWGGVFGVYVYYAYEMLHDEKFMRRLDQGSSWRPWVITKFVGHSLYLVPAWFAYDIAIGAREMTTSSWRRLTRPFRRCPVH